MSKIKLTGHASGSGVLTIAAPNTDSDRTITLPDVTGTLLDSGSTLDATKLTGTIPSFTSTGIDDNADATAITIDSSERIGIGTTSPTEKLQVHGSIRSTNNATTTLANSGNFYYIPTADDASNPRTVLSGIGTSSVGAHVTFKTGTSSSNAERMRIDSSGNVGIGVVPESNWISDETALQVGGIASLSATTAAGGGNWTSWGNNFYKQAAGGSGRKYIETGYASNVYMGDGAFYIDVAASGSADAAISWTTALHILQYDQTLDMYRGVQIKTDALRSAIGTFRQTTSNSSHIEFRNTNGFIGSIKTNGTATSFNTSSDYRLKENVDYTWDATTRLKQLKPARFNFISDEDNTLVDGFLAHEVSSVVPEAISGTKDATETLSNAIVMPNGISVASGITEEEWTTGKEDGTYPADTTWKASHTQDVHQSIDQSKLVPLLVKTIQELEARITTLEG